MAGSAERAATVLRAGKHLLRVLSTKETRKREIRLHISQTRSCHHKPAPLCKRRPAPLFLRGPGMRCGPRAVGSQPQLTRSATKGSSFCETKPLNTVVSIRMLFISPPDDRSAGANKGFCAGHRLPTGPVSRIVYPQMRNMACGSMAPGE